MTDEQIKQNAEAYINKMPPLCDALYESVAKEAYIAGAHSRDEEIRQLRNPWISVTDEKPEQDRDVIFMLPDGLVYRGFRKVIGIRDRVFLRGAAKGTNCYMIDDVANWMKIPELKKGK